MMAALKNKSELLIADGYDFGLVGTSKVAFFAFFLFFDMIPCAYKLNV